MSKAVKMARVSAKGGFNLFWGLAASTIISAVGVILVARLLSPSEYGIVAIIMIGPNLISIFQDWGISTAMIRHIAQYDSENKPANVTNTLAAGLIFEIVSGFLLSIVSFLLSGFLATNVFQRPDIKPLIEIASFTILAGALLAAAQSAFTGTERMELNSVTIIFQSCLKTVLMPLLIILGLGTFGAVLGMTAALLIGGLMGILLLLALYKKLLQKKNDGRLKIIETIKTMFKYGLPLSISAMIGGFLTQFYLLLIAIYTTDLMVGNYSVATNFAVLITFFATPISTVLLPAFSKLDSQKEKETLRNVFQFSVKYAALIVVPATAAIMALSQPVVFALFGEEYVEAPLFLALIVIGYLFSAFGSLSIGNLINSQGHTRVNLLLTIVSSAIGFPLCLILIPRFGIMGLLITLIVDGIPSLIIGLYWIKTHYGAIVDWISSSKILLSSTTAAAITYVVISQLSFVGWVELIIGAAIFILAFIIATPAIRAINGSDINNLREMLRELGPLRPLFDFLLNIIEKLMAIFQL